MIVGNLTEPRIDIALLADLSDGGVTERTLVDMALPGGFSLAGLRGAAQCSSPRAVPPASAP
eukprot:7108229-Pyramimonas_sp.AAC.1